MGRLILFFVVAACAVAIAAQEVQMSVDDVKSAVFRAMAFEHAKDRVEAIEATRVRAALRNDEMADILLGIATNRNNRFALRDFTRYATTNHLFLVGGLVVESQRPAAFRVAAFRVFSDIDGFGERTDRLVNRIAVKDALFTAHDREKMLSHINTSLPSNDTRRVVFASRLACGKAKETGK